MRNKAFWAGVIVRNVVMLACLLIAAASGLEQSWRYGALGEYFSGMSYPTCATDSQVEGISK